MDKQKKERICELVEKSLESDDYSFEINFLISGLIMSESNITDDQVACNNSILKEIRQICMRGNEDKEKSEFLQRTIKRIDKYLGAEN